MENKGVQVMEDKPTDATESRSVTLKLQDNGVALVKLDLPDSKVNLLGPVMLGELHHVINKLAVIPNLKGVVITSGKDDNFIAGADVKEIQSLQSQSEINAYEAAQVGKEIFQKLSSLPVHVVAAIHGTCLGGGTELALACNYRIASKSGKTKIGLPEVNLGFVPGWGACVRLPKLVGLNNALQLIPAGKIVDAKKAWRYGLVDETVEQEKLIARAEQIALDGRVKRYSPPIGDLASKILLEGNPIGRKIMADMALKMIKRQTKGNYPAPVEAAKLILKTAEEPMEKSFERESRVFAKLAVTDVSKNLVGIFFAQNESKKMPSNAKPAVEVKTVGVLGAGVMGAGIAQAAAKAGYKVVLRDIKPEFVERGMTTIRGLFGGLVEKRKMTEAESTECLARITATTEYAQFADCDLVIEAVLEKVEVKKEVLKELQNVISKDFIFGSNTSSLSVTEIAEGARNPGNVVGIHFFNPVHKMPLVEIVRGKQTSDPAVAAALAFAMKLGKTTVITGDAPGFVVNRILTPYVREATILMEQGVPLEDIEKAMTSFGMPMGPLALIDEVGMDISAEVNRVLHRKIGDRLAPPAILTSLEGAKLLGKKGGKGIYLYDENGKRDGFNPDVLSSIKAQPNKKMRGELQDRMVLIMVNEAARALEEGVITDPAQLDLAMIMGTGFPPFRGGLFRYADAIGAKVLFEKLEWLAKVNGPNYEPAELIRKKAASGETFYPVVALHAHSK
jgi:3-hydroxyacyl-CoA dehydrogenase/enoyl-CoA hydratase/3-hydroxybutyryl-CoA epimerase